MCTFYYLGSVFCVALDVEQNKLVITGDEYDNAFLWNTETGEVQLECTSQYLFVDIQLNDQMPKRTVAWPIDVIF